jgi:hypothetical protein
VNGRRGGAPEEIRGVAPPDCMAHGQLLHSGEDARSRTWACPVCDVAATIRSPEPGYVQWIITAPPGQVSQLAFRRRRLMPPPRRPV